MLSQNNNPKKNSGGKSTDIFPMLIIIMVGALLGSMLFRNIMQSHREGSFTITFDDLPGKESHVFYNRVEEATQASGKTGYIYYYDKMPLVTVVEGQATLTEPFMLMECVAGYTGSYTIRNSEWGDISYDHGMAYEADNLQFTSPVSIVDVYKAADENGLFIIGQERQADGSYLYKAMMKDKKETGGMSTKLYNVSRDGRFTDVSRVIYKYKEAT